MSTLQQLIGSLLVILATVGNGFAEPITVVYKIQPPPVTPKDYQKLDLLTKNIIRTIAPASWDRNGGVGQILQVNNSLVIHNSPATLAKVQRASANVLLPVTKKRKNSLSQIQSLKRFAKGLQKPINMIEFDDTPLDLAVETLADHSEIKIKLDLRSLDNLGVSVDTPVTCELRSTSTLSVLNLLLRTIDPSLTWIPTTKELVITTLDVAENNLVKQTYKTSRFARRSADPKLTQLETIEAIVSTVDPLSWEEVGGTAIIREMKNGDITVMQTAKNHVKIWGLISNIEAAN